MERILQIGMTYKLGGIQTYLMNCHRNLDKKMFQFDYVNIHDSIDDLYFGKEILELGGKIWQIPNYRKYPIKSFKAIRKIINENNYKIVHCNMNSAVYLLPLIAGKFSNAKVVISHSHNNSSDKGILKSLVHWINKHFIPFFATDYFACSDKAGEWFYSKKIRSGVKYKIINNAIDVSKFKYNEKIRFEIRNKMGITNNIVLGHVGRFSKQKNHDFLIEILNELLKLNDNYKLLLIGDGPLKEEIAEKVNKLGLKNSVAFLGIIDNVNEIMQAIDIFLLPSFYEGAPVVSIEAQASGLNCFLSDNITKEVKILDTTRYISLNESAFEWAKIINSTAIRNERNNIDNEFKKSGYDVKTETLRLQKIYMDLIKRG